MDASTHALLLGLALSAAAPAPSGQVTGTVVMLRKLPPAKVWKLEPEMVRLGAGTELVDQAWLVGKDGGLANCVVLLYPKGIKGSFPVTPLVNVLFEKVLVGYAPRVLVVPPGSKVTLRNRNSPCRGFISGSPWHTFAEHVPAGKQKVVTLGRRPGPFPVRCDLRPYMLGWIYVADTPYYATTGQDGAFRIAHVPAGDYAVRVWHEREGRLTAAAGPLHVTVRPRQASALHYRIK
jgi:hypothetical protein